MSGTTVDTLQQESCRDGQVHHRKGVILGEDAPWEGRGAFVQHNREKWLNWRCEEDYETLCTSEFLTGFLFGLLALLWFIMLCFTYRAELKHCESHQVTGCSVSQCRDTQLCGTSLLVFKKSLETQIRYCG